MTEMRTDDQLEKYEKMKKNLEFAQLKVIEEASEVINELTDSFTKPTDWNEKDLVLELGDLQARIKLMNKAFEDIGFDGFSARVKKAKKDKLKSILNRR